MTELLKDIIIGIISGLITTSIIRITWNATIPLWAWLLSTILLILLIYLIKYIVQKIRVNRFISEFTECSLGDSCVYKWKYKRNRKGRYSAYGYEATDIQKKTLPSETNNEKVFICGHDVSEETIKLFVQLCMLATIDKKMSGKLKPTLEYLNWIEDSQKHQLLH